MQKQTTFTRDNSRTVAFRLLNEDYDRLQDAMKKSNITTPGEFARLASINEIEFVEKQ